MRNAYRSKLIPLTGAIISIGFGAVMAAPEFTSGTLAPAPVMTPNTVISTPVTVPVPPVIPITAPAGVFTPDIVVPTDVTNLDVVHGPFDINPQTAALRGIKSIDSSKFPERDDIDDNAQGMVVWTDATTRYERTSPCSLNLVKGKALISVRNPSHLALVHTPLGEVAIQAEGDVLIAVGNPVMRVMNLDGRGESVKLKLDQGPFKGQAEKTLAIAPGFEVIAATEKLTKIEIRPSDGFARRHHKVLFKGYLAVQEFSVESVLNSSGLIAQMTQELSGKKIDRIVGDMSKMAAVLNYMNGTQGYVAQDSGSIEN